MKLIPHCRRVKIRIEFGENGEKSCASIEALKQNFYIEDIIPLVRDGRLQRWLEDLHEDGLAQAVVQISSESGEDNKKQMAFKLLCTFLPAYFHYDIENVLPTVIKMHDIYDHEALFQIINIFKEDISKDKIITFWDELVKQYPIKEFQEIISKYKNSDKDIAFKWACMIQERRGIQYSDAMETAARLGHAEAIEFKKKIFETDCYAWRDVLKTDDNCPTTYKELRTLFTDIIPNGKQFCKFKPLESFYMDVWHIYKFLKDDRDCGAWGKFNQEKYEPIRKQIYERFGKSEIEKDPMRIERNFINKLAIWHQYDVEYMYDDISYKESEDLLRDKSQPTAYWKGIIAFNKGDEIFYIKTFWEQILFITVNIFNKQLYPDWK